MEILIITGPPYSGKGTQCEILKEQLKFEHISTGDRCRSEKQNETEIGKIMSEYEEKGDLVQQCYKLAFIRFVISSIVPNPSKVKTSILDFIYSIAGLVDSSKISILFI